MYFQDFPNFLYDFEINGKRKAFLVTDITRNIRIRKELLQNVTIYDQYDIIDGETPEIIAEKIYGDAQYHWVIMLANERYDYLADFPLDQPRLEAYIVDKYGESAEDVHHYEDSNGFVVNEDSPGAAPVSNKQFEEDLNEQKRRIKIVSPQLLNTILENYKDII